MRIWPTVCGLLLTVLLAGCDMQSLFDAFVPKDEAAIGRQYLENLRTGKYDLVESKLNPSLKSPETHTAFERMAALFPKETPKDIKVIGSNTVTTPTETHYNFTFEYEFSRAWALGTISFRKPKTGIVIDGMYVTPLTDSMEHINAFTFEGKTPLHFAFLTLAILFALFSIGTTVMCFRTPIPKRRWLWVIFVLLGFVSFTLDWTTGAIRWNLLSFVLFGAAFTKEFYGPVILQIAIPIGAVLFWMRRGHWIREAVPTDDFRSAQ